MTANYDRIDNDWNKLKVFLCKHYKHETGLRHFTSMINRFRFDMSKSVELNCMDYAKLEAMRVKHFKYEKEYHANDKLWI